MGAGIYVGTFLLGNIWDYRLIFLLFTIPQLAEWAQQRNGIFSNIARSAVVTLVISCWYFVIWKSLSALTIYGHRLAYIIDESANWVLFAGLVYLLVRTLPEWVFEDISNLVRKTGIREGCIANSEVKRQPVLNRKLSAQVRKFYKLDATGGSLVCKAMSCYMMNISVRAYRFILNLARKFTDQASSEQIQMPHMAYSKPGFILTTFDYPNCILRLISYNLFILLLFFPLSFDSGKLVCSTVMAMDGWQVKKSSKRHPKSP